MATISDMDRSVFKEAAYTVLDSFTQDELIELRSLAEQTKLS